MEHVLPCYSFRDNPALHTATEAPSPSANTYSSESTQELVEGNTHSHLAVSVSLPSNGYDNEERSLLLNSSWQSEPPEADQQRRVLLQLQKQCTMREEEEEEEEEEKEGDIEQHSMNVVKHIGKAAKLKRFFRLLKNSMSRQPLPEQTEKEQQSLVEPASSMTAAHNPEQLYRLIAQRRLCADAARPGSLYSQADSAYGSRSGSESNSIRRRSTAAVSTLTSNCPSHDEYCRQDSLLSSREGTFSSRQGAAAKMRFPLGQEHRAIEKHAKEREDSNPLYENVRKQGPPTRRHIEGQHPAPDIANVTKSNGVETPVESPHPADYEDDDDPDLPEQRLMMMTAGCARASRRKPQFLMYTKRRRNALSRNKYSPVNTNPQACSGTVTEESHASPSPTKAYLPLCTDDGEMLSLSTCMTRRLSSREGCISGEFNKIIHYLHDLHSSLCQALKEDSVSLNGESSDHESQHSDNEETRSPSPLPIQEAEIYLQAAVILQKALSTLSLDMEEMMKLPGEDEYVLQQVQ